MKLNNLQGCMCDFVFHKSNETTLTSELIDYPPNELLARISIYQNNTFHSLTEALKDLYPSLVNTVGNEFIEAVGRAYLDARPPQSAAMVEFAHDFPDFIEKNQDKIQTPYLTDLARLDLYRHLSYHAADQKVMSAEDIATLGFDIFAGSRVEFHSSAALLQSDYAIFDIWQLANGDIDTQIEADQAQTVLVTRPFADVEMYNLAPSQFEFLTQLTQQETVQSALEIAIEKFPDFNPTHAISFLFQSGLISQIFGEIQ